MGQILKNDTSLLEGFNRLLPPESKLTFDWSDRGLKRFNNGHKVNYEPVLKKAKRSRDEEEEDEDDDDLCRHGTLEDLEFFDKVETGKFELFLFLFFSLS